MDMEKIVERVTKEIMRQLNQNKDKESILLVTENMDNPLQKLLNHDYEVDCCNHLAVVSGYDYVIVPAKYMNQINHAKCEGLAECAVQENISLCSGKELDLTDKKLIQERELRELCKEDVASIKLNAKAIITPLAADFLRTNKIQIIR